MDEPGPGQNQASRLRRCVDRAAAGPARTVEIYRGLLRRHVAPYLGNVPLAKIDTPMIRDWRAQLLDQGVSVSEAAKAYRFVRAVLMTTADDRIIPRNPCRVRGAGEEKPDERPTLTVRQVYGAGRPHAG
jgi:Phage integrase, N-terminal SAM-like domain